MRILEIVFLATHMIIAYPCIGKVAHARIREGIKEKNNGGMSLDYRSCRGEKVERLCMRGSCRITEARGGGWFNIVTGALLYVFLIVDLIFLISFLLTVSI